MVPTKHFQWRAIERGLARDVEEFILAWGTMLEAPKNASYFTVVRRELPAHLQNTMIAHHAMDWVLVVAADGAIITCYRKRDAWRTLRRHREERHGKSRAA